MSDEGCMVSVDWGDSVSRGAAVLVERLGGGVLLVRDELVLDPGCDEVRVEGGRLVEYRKGSRVRETV